MNDHDYLTHRLKGIVLKPEQMRLARSVDARGILFRCRFPNAPFVSISDNQRAPLREANWIGTIYYGLPAELFSPSFEAGSYLAFLGRLTTEKGPDAAIRIARAAKMPLLIAAKVPREERKYFKEEIDPQIDGDQIQLIGEVNDQTKRQFLAGAAALQFPIDWPEQFGLVMIESLACGTPVIAFNSGSVPEVLDEGITGFVVPGEAEAIQAIARLSELDQRQVRRHFEKRFTIRRMAQEYLRHYEALSDRTPAKLVLTSGSPALQVQFPDRRSVP
jgi:glycosyltransferase involved in cell wall biosynthesis